MFSNYNSHNEHRRQQILLPGAFHKSGQAAVATSLPEGRFPRRENLQVVYTCQSSSSVYLFTLHGGQIKRSYLCSGDLWLLKQSKFFFWFMQAASLILLWLPDQTSHNTRDRFKFFWLIQRLDQLVPCEETVVLFLKEVQVVFTAMIL